jgi:hypothetical protein
MRTSLVFILIISISMKVGFAQISNSQFVYTKFDETIDTSLLSFFL